MACSSCGSNAPKNNSNNYSPKKISNWGGMKPPSGKPGGGVSGMNSNFGSPSVKMSFGKKKY